MLYSIFTSRMVINIRKVALAEATLGTEQSTIQFAHPPQHQTSAGVSSDPGHGPSTMQFALPPERPTSAEVSSDSGDYNEEV
jgi:hypothetical protein